MATDINIDNPPALLALLFLAGVIVLWVFSTTGGSVLFGAFLLALIIIAVYYIGVRIDRRLRGG